MKIIDIAVFVNMLVLIFNVAIAYFSMANGELELLIFNLGCAICSGLVAIVCAVVRK